MLAVLPSTTSTLEDEGMENSGGSGKMEIGEYKQLINLHLILRVWNLVIFFPLIAGLETTQVKFEPSSDEETGLAWCQNYDNHHDNQTWPTSLIL